MIAEIAKSLKNKTRWFDIIEIQGWGTPIIFKNNRIHSVNEKENKGYGIRVNIDNKTGFSYTNTNYKKSLENTAERAIAASRFGDIEKFTLPSDLNQSFIEPYSEEISLFNLKDQIEQAENLIHSISTLYKDSNIDLSVNKSTGSMRLINSEGIDVSYKSSYYSISAAVTYITDNGSKIDLWENRSSLKPEPYEDISQTMIQKLELAKNEKKCSSRKIPIILTPKAFTRVLSIVGSGLNGRSIYKKISHFTDKYKKKVFSDQLTIIDDPLIADSPFSYPIDDEGIKARKKVLIDKGIINNFITDLSHAEKLKMKPTGNGSRGYSSLPSPSFSNTVIENGTIAHNDLIKTIKKGIIVEQFIGFGQSNTLTGDFSASLDMAFLIENGEITGRVKDSMISGNIFDLLAQDIVLTKEREQAGATLAPYILLDGVNFTG